MGCQDMCWPVGSLHLLHTWTGCLSTVTPWSWKQLPGPIKAACSLTRHLHHHALLLAMAVTIPGRQRCEGHGCRCKQHTSTAWQQPSCAVTPEVDWLGRHQQEPEPLLTQSA